MITVDVSRCGGQVDVANRRLKRICDKLGILKRMRQGNEEIKPSVQRKKDKAAARKRLEKSRSKQSYDLRQAEQASRKRRRTVLITHESHNESTDV